MATGSPCDTRPVSGVTAGVGQRLLGDKFTCLICGQENLTEEEMRSHVLLEHVECNVCCPFCDLSGITGDEMSLHINKVHFDDLMSPIEKSKDGACSNDNTDRSNVKDTVYAGREDADRFGLEHGGAIPKTNTKSSLKHSHSLDQGSPSHRSPKKNSGLKISQSESNISRRGKLQLNFPSVNEPATSIPSQTGIRSSTSAYTMTGSASSNSFRSSSSTNSIQASTSLDAFPGVSNNNNEISHSNNRLRIQNGNQTDVIMEEHQAGQENNNVPLQPNFNQILTPDINDNIEPDINSNMPAGFSCPLCQFITSSENLIQTHVNMAHVDVLSPAKPPTNGVSLPSVGGFSRTKTEPSCSTSNGMASLDEEYPCPICMRIFTNSGELSLHVNAEHSNIFSPDKNDPGLKPLPGTSQDMEVDGEAASTSGFVCPVCDMVFYNKFRLQSHVNGHFSAEQTPVQEKTDKLIAQVLQEKENNIVVNQEQQDFHKLQEMYGMKDGTPYKKQYEKNLEKAVASGDMTVVEFHERKNGFKQADSKGVDDGTSCTKGVIQRLQEYYRTPTHGVSRSWLCTGVDHLAGSYGDRGWGCGYRNFQMLLSSLMSDPLYCKILFNGKPLMPSIPKIQRLIESAWGKGFDHQGREQLGGKVLNTTKWIGATEIVATLASLKVKCRLLDFHNPSGPNGTHTKLFDWVKEYYQRPATFRPPLYLQHQGHSRTIIGIEELKDKRLRLLIFDPSTPKKQVQLFHSIVNANIMRTLRRSVEGLKAKQYQIVAVTGILNDHEYEASKILKSERLS